MTKTADEYRVTHKLGTVLQLTLWVTTIAVFVIWTNSSNRYAAAVSSTANEVYKSIVNMGLESRIVAEANGKIIMCSPTAAHICGYTPDEMIDNPFQFVIADGFKEECEKLFATAIREEPPGQVHISRWNLVRKDGSIRPAEVIIRSVDGPIGRVAVITITATEKIQMAEPRQELTK